MDLTQEQMNLIARQMADKLEAHGIMDGLQDWDFILLTEQYKA